MKTTRINEGNKYAQRIRANKTQLITAVKYANSLARSEDYQMESDFYIKGAGLYLADSGIIVDGWR